MSSIILGIDPGLSGGLAWLSDWTPTTRVHVTDALTHAGKPCDAVFEHTLFTRAVKWEGKTEHGVVVMLRDLQSIARDAQLDLFAFIERVHAMPPKFRGSIGTTKLMQNYGFWRGALIACGIAFEEVGAQKWQGALGCRSGGDKNVTKQRAQQLFPKEVVTHATADALLIAEYGRRKRTGQL